VVARFLREKKKKKENGRRNTFPTLFTQGGKSMDSGRRVRKKSRAWKRKDHCARFRRPEKEIEGKPSRIEAMD